MTQVVTLSWKLGLNQGR